jgi:hypothetical protein
MRYILLIAALFSFTHLSAQKKMNAIEVLEKIRTEGGGILEVRINENGDTTFHISMRQVIIYPRRVFKSKWQRRKYNRLVRNVKKVYPYSLIIRDIFIESEYVLRNMENNSERKQYIKQKERELKKEFEDDIRNMTYSQGRILIKLVDRETTYTSYQLVKHFKGGVSAFFWQGVAKIFQTDLKYEYDPDGTDQWIEEIVSRIENGTL